MKTIKIILPIFVIFLWFSACQVPDTQPDLERHHTATAEKTEPTQQVVTETRNFTPHIVITATSNPMPFTEITPTVVPTPTQIPFVDRRQFAYQTYEMHLYLTNIDDYSERKLDCCVPSSIDRYYWGFSPDGRMIYTGTLDDESKIIHLEDDIVVPLEFRVDYFSWTIDASRLLLRYGEYNEQTGSLEWRLVLIDTATGSIIHEFENQDFGGSFGSFHPDNSLIVADGKSFLFYEPVLDTNGQLVGISESSYRQFDVSIEDRGISNLKVSPDGNKIAFIAYNRDSIQWADLFVVNLDGTGLVNLTHEISAQNPDRQVTYEQFSWSPDSTKIAFYTYNYFDDLYVFDIFLSNHPKVYVVEIDGSSWIEITDENYPYGRSPSWSPDGQKLLFVGAQGIQDWPDLILCNSDGKDKQIVPGIYPIMNAIFRPGLRLP